MCGFAGCLDLTAPTDGVPTGAAAEVLAAASPASAAADRTTLGGRAQARRAADPGPDLDLGPGTGADAGGHAGERALRAIGRDNLMDEAVRIMTASLAHRGPDGGGYAAVGPVRLGFRRLAVIDPAGGHQPMHTPDGRGWIVFNGEIYNHAQLRAELEACGERFTTDSDTEVLLALCRRAGVHGLQRLRGMFAFAYWDASRRRLLAARDRFGIKPLYYLRTHEQLWFASEQKALADLAGARLDLPALEQFFRFQYVPEPATALAGVQALPAGCWLEARADGVIRTGRWWRPTFAPARPTGAARHGAAGARASTRRGARAARLTAAPEPAIRAVLRDSVRAHLVSDTPVGAFLSGGIDSTCVVALAREVDPDIETFSVGFDLPGYSELPVARRTAAALGVRNTAYLVSMEEFARELPGIVRDLDTPVADPAAVPLWFLAREARKRVKVVLSGEGADELFGGYRIYRQPWVVRAADRLPDRLRTPLAALGARLPAGLRGKGLLERMATPLPERYIGNARIFTEQELTRLTSSLPLAGHTSALDVTGPLWAGAGRLDDVAAMQHIDVNTWLVGDILVKADRMTMAHGLELRVPFLDPEVFRVTAALPRAAKVGRRTTKLALRRAMAGVVPEHVLWRPKLGFPVPIRHWLAGDLHDWAAEIIASAPAGDFIDTAYGLDLLRRHRLGKLDLSRRIWAVLVFSLWHRALVDPSPNQLITDQPPRALPRPPAPGRPGGSGHGLSGTG